MDRRLRLIGLSMFCLGFFMLWAVACSTNNDPNKELTCSADHNCDSGQKCIDGKCKAGPGPATDTGGG